MQQAVSGVAAVPPTTLTHFVHPACTDPASLGPHPLSEVEATQEVLRVTQMQEPPPGEVLRVTCDDRLAAMVSTKQSSWQQQVSTTIEQTSASRVTTTTTTTAITNATSRIARRLTATVMASATRTLGASRLWEGRHPCKVGLQTGMQLMTLMRSRMMRLHEEGKTVMSGCRREVKGGARLLIPIPNQKLRQYLLLGLQHRRE